MARRQGVEELARGIDYVLVLRNEDGFTVKQDRIPDGERLDELRRSEL